MICKTCKKEFTQVKGRNGIALSRECIICLNNRKKDKQITYSKKLQNSGLKREINKVSKSQKKKNMELSKIKKSLPQKCFYLGCQNKGLHLMHILPKSIFPEYYIFPDNFTLGCPEHHELFDNFPYFRRKQTELYEQVKAFDEQSANRYFNF